MAKLDDETLAQIAGAAAEAVWRRQFPSDKTAGQMLGGIYSRSLVTRDLAKRMAAQLGDAVTEDELADALAKAVADSVG